MRIVEFPEQTVVYAKDQQQYLTLPAYQYRNDPKGRIACCWRLTWRERVKVLLTGKVWHQVLTFNSRLQPQLLSVDKPDMPPEDTREVLA